MTAPQQWIEMKPIGDGVIFADQGGSGFDRARAWRAALAGANHLELEEVRTELDAKYVEGMGYVPVVRWWTR